MDLQKRIDDVTRHIEAFRCGIPDGAQWTPAHSWALAIHLVRNAAQIEEMEVSGMDYMDDAKRQYQVVREATADRRVVFAEERGRVANVAASIAIGIELRAIGAALGNLQDAIEGVSQRHPGETIP